MSQYSPNLIHRFWASVTKSTRPEDHWLWTASIGKNGYGILYTKEAGNASSTIYAHRFSYILDHDEGIPEGLLICHKPPCVIRHCVNPSHLYAGTDRDNHNDAILLGRIPRGPEHSCHREARQRYIAKAQTHIQQPRKKKANIGEQNNHSKLTTLEVQEIRRLYYEKDFTHKQIANLFGVQEPAVYKILTYQTWKHIN